MNRNEAITALQLGRIVHVGCVVRDLDRTVRHYEETLGMGPFIRREFRPEKSYVKGRRGAIDLKIGSTELTPDLSLELIEIVGGEPYHRDFLEQHGEGVQHLGFLPEDYDRALERAADLGIEVLMWAEADLPGIGRVRGAYLDTRDLVGVLLELVDIKPL